MSFWSKVRGAVMTVAAILNLNSKVCFDSDGIGCFYNKAPFNNARGLLPQSPEKVQVKFYLYTRINRLTPQEVKYNSVSQSYFSGTRDTKFIIHGYRDDCFESWVYKMKDALLDKGDFNVFCVDWEKGADQVDYNQAVANTRVVGALTSKFAEKLKHANAKYSDMHLIGHSLGAHIAGYTGKRVNTLARITGLDPAGYRFESKHSSVRLDKSDAKYVDIIHTDGEPLTSLGFGLKKAIGHADFYPNGGEDQPGCKKVGPHVFKLITGKFKEFIKGVACDHARARDLFIESIKTSCRFKAYPCKSKDDFEAGKCNQCNGKCVRLGYSADLNPVVGKFFLSTNKKTPFCLN